MTLIYGNGTYQIMTQNETSFNINDIIKIECTNFKKRRILNNFSVVEIDLLNKKSYFDL